ncbi:uncharacterized protein LOC101861731 [Aplysia californica]|uniref:Uncharacterized protein LOC101861731 n=1 Tax=Aplysia californica TaxID=6500 RepID=A0ABM0JQA6_APLCA|nr:uncharacterized protein LOC101861731 [Aplysia californica]
MGGSSSKQRKCKSSLKYFGEEKTVAESSFSNTATNNNTRTELSSSCTKKKKGKNNVKIKESDKNDKKKSKKKDNRRVQTGSCQNVDTIFIVENSDVEAEEPNSPVYRKKSSCPSCEAKDILMGINRSRSPSAKSLRYSDFNKVTRKTKIYDSDLKSVDIPLYGVPQPTAEETCYVCGVFTGYQLRTCRVCLRAYHDGCLAKVGHGLSEVARTQSTRGHWSCHQCVSLNHLLTQEEVRGVMEAVIDLGISSESISEADYLKYCKDDAKASGKKMTEEREASCSHRFRQMDKANKGQLSWTQFLNMESIRILDNRCSRSLVNLLTQAELQEARTVFQNLDREKKGVAKKSDIHAMFDSDKSRSSTHFPDEAMMYTEEDLSSLVPWGDFLCHRAIYILAERPNWMNAAEHSEEDLLEDVAITPSFESIDDDDDDDYNTCTSELGASASSAGPMSPRYGMSSCYDSSGDNLVDTPDSSAGVLDDDMTSSGADKSEQNLDAGRCPGSKMTRTTGQESTTVERPGYNDGKGLRFSSTEQNRSSLAKQLQNTQQSSSAQGKKEVEQNKPTPQRRSGTVCSPGLLQRRSEVIERRPPPLITADRELKAKSHVALKANRGIQIAPAFGNLVGKMQHSSEWQC